MTITLFGLDEGLRFLFLIMRLSAMVLTLPFLNFRMVPSPVKIVLIVVLSVGLYPVVRLQPLYIPRGPVELGILILGELFLGMIVGFVAQLVFAGIQLGGMIINQQMGLSMASMLDPQNAQQSSIIANFQYITAVLVFFSVQAHHGFIYTMAESLHTIPLLDFTVSKNVIVPLVALLAKAFIMAVRLSAPVLVTLLLANVALGIVARLVPQMNIFVLSFPVNFGVGLIVLALALPYIVMGFRHLFADLGRDLLGILNVVSGG